MNKEKSATTDMNHKHGLFFIIILAALLALINIALEWKTPYDNGGYNIDETIEDVKQPANSSVILKTKAINNDTVSD